MESAVGELHHGMASRVLSPRELTLVLHYGSSFPHGKKAPVVLAVLLSLGGFALTCYMGIEFGIAMGFMVVLIAGMTSCMKVPAMALNLAAVAALAIAGSHLTAAYDMYGRRKSITGIATMCSTLASVSNGDDDMFAAYYREFQKYCSNNVFYWHGAALVVWVLAGVVIFLVPARAEPRMFDIRDLDHDQDEPTTEYNKQGLEVA
jgi:hypothetical protein